MIPAAAQPAHGIAMHGEPALPPGFTALPYANPDAPKGGRIVLGAVGGFDSVHPFILKGRPAQMVAALTFETLMARSLDEPFSLYGLLAESIETDETRSFVEFTLRAGARFSDGSPVTVEDVLWSMEILGTEGAPRFLEAWRAVARAEATGPRSVRFTFDAPNRELPLLLGLRPILKKAAWEGRDFAASTLEPLTGSGPYRIAAVDPGRSVTYVRRADWWGADLAVNRGLHNFDTIRIDYFADPAVAFEAFKAGVLSSWRETNPARWATGFDFPAVAAGDVMLSEIPHHRPSGIEGFAMNSRRAPFSDWRVRQAMILAFNFDFVNRTLTGGAAPRIVSYFANSDLGAAVADPAPAAERALLDPYAASLPPGALDGYALPATDGTQANRAGIRAAARLLEEAGWTVQGGVLKNAAGQPFSFEILLVNGSDDLINAAAIYVQALERLGIRARIATVDEAQYVERTGRFDFDMTHYVRALSLSPGTEQRSYWGSGGVDTPGSRNWPGIDSPAVDGLIDRMLAVTDPAAFRTTVRALDRVLTAGAWVVPIWYADRARIAHRADLAYPDRLPVYGDWPGFQPEVWWQAPPP